MSLTLLTIAYKSFDFYIIIIIMLCSPTRANYNVMYMYIQEKLVVTPYLLLLFFLFWGN